MTLRRLLPRLSLVVCLMVSTHATAGNCVPKELKDRVLELLFPVEVDATQYLTRAVLRYGDTDTQLVVLVYPAYPRRSGGQAEVLRYSVAGMREGGLSAFIEKEITRTPNVTARQLAERLKVVVTRLSVDPALVKRSMEALAAIRISPALQTRTAVDNYSRYDLWFDTGQECVHYSITTPSNGSPQDQIAEWMNGFRKGLVGLGQSGSAATH